MPDIAVQPIEILPLEVNRTIAPHLLGGSKAQYMFGVDLDYHQGVIRRGSGFIKLQCAGVLYEVVSCFVGVQRNGNRILFAQNLNGDINAFGSDGGRAESGPVPIEQESQQLDTTDFDNTYNDMPTDVDANVYTV